MHMCELLLTYMDVNWCQRQQHITDKTEKNKLQRERHLQAYASALAGHAGFRSDGEDERGGDDDDGVEADCRSGSVAEEDSSMQTGLIQKAFLRPLPFLVAPPCWSAWNMSSLLLLLCSRSLCSSLSTRWIIHSRLLSTFTHTFSCNKQEKTN